MLTALNAGAETPGSTQSEVIPNLFDSSPESGAFVHIGGEQDGFIPPIPALEANGKPHHFSDRALFAGAQQTIDLTRQGQYVPLLGTVHLENR